MSRKRGADYDPYSLPDRWMGCPRRSFSLIGGKFLAFKTPLDSRYNDKMNEEYYFQPDMVFKSVKDMNKKLGLWIDLTNTTRFYDKTLVEQKDCKYVKLNCKGHGETPSPQTVEVFVKLCSQFISQNPIAIIGIHCTHGFNRTGYLIVSYLVQAMDWSVEAAVAEFSKAR